MSKITRRQTLARGGQAVAAAAMLPVIPTIALGAGQDAGLFARVEAFWAAHKEAVGRYEKRVAECTRIEALPECPAFRFPGATREDFLRHYAFLDEHGIGALANASGEAWEREARAVKLVFDIPAKTYQGVLAKLKIVEEAYGTGAGDGDMNLESSQDLDTPWLESVIGDFERLAGRAI